MKARRSLPLLVIGAFGLAACGTPFPTGGAPYTYRAPSSGTVVASASSLAGANDREFFYSTDTTYTDSSACETVDGTSPNQPGIVFRITDTDNVTTAISVTENVFGTSGYNDFNVHSWNSSQSPAFSLVGHVRVDALASSLQPEPLNLCAEIAGNVLQIVAWTSGTRPAWGDPTRGGGVTLPSGVPANGYTGFFAGHIPAGTSTVYSNLTVDEAVNNPLRCCVSTESGANALAG